MVFSLSSGGNSISRLIRVDCNPGRIISEDRQNTSINKIKIIIIIKLPDRDFIPSLKFYLFKITKF